MLVLRNNLISQFKLTLIKYTYIIDPKFHNLTLDKISQYNFFAYFIFNKQYQLKHKDLAIGVFTSLVFINFYLVFNKVKFVMNFDMYIRSNDKIFVLAECKKSLSKVDFDGLKITWKTSFDYSQFLNIKVFQD